MIILRESINIDLYNLSEMLSHLKINGLHIFSINKKELEKMEVTTIERPSKINYLELGVIKFIEILDSPDKNFLEYNKNSLYILRNGDYKDIKNFLTRIQDNEVSIVRGSSQKSHIMSPIELRLSSYLIAIFNLDSKRLSYLNKFNDLPKSKYLPLFI